MNTICPFADSEGVRENIDESVIAMMRKSVPLGRLGDCETDIGRAVVFLASDDASFVTSNTLWVDGGGGSTRG